LLSVVIMKTTQGSGRKRTRNAGSAQGPARTALTASVLSGVAAGAVAGSAAGPAGVVTGVVVGGAMGAAAGKALDDQNADEAVRQAKLDREIGVTAGGLGAAKPGAPQARHGAFSASSSGAGGAEPENVPAEGGIVPSEAENT
jgi:hypothetical protein